MLLPLRRKGEREVKANDSRGTASRMGILGSLNGSRSAGLRSVQLNSRNEGATRDVQEE